MWGSLRDGGFCKLRPASELGRNSFETEREVFFLRENIHLNNSLSTSLEKILKKHPLKHRSLEFSYLSCILLTPSK